MQIKNILILGSGGREEALADAYSKNKNVKAVFIAPGNGLTGFRNKKVRALLDTPVNDFKKILQASEAHKIDLVDVASDEPLSLGFVDMLQKEGMHAFGASKNAAEIEWNKEWSRDFMKKYKLPIPQYVSFTDSKKAISYIEKLPEQPLYVKASGLALGKGALFAANKKEAISAVMDMKKFGNAGNTFLIEECMVGEEFSLFVLCDGKDYVVIGAAQDHKTVFNKNVGPNTGGMGCVFPGLVVTSKIIKECEDKIVKPFMKGMIAEERPYSGVLYVGGMITHTGIKIVEFNARWGDPEAEVILSAIKTDYLSVIEKIIDKKLKGVKITLDQKTRVSVAGCASGYPDDYKNVKGKKIFGLETVSKRALLYGSGIAKHEKNLLVNGGRIFHIVGVGKDVIESRAQAYSEISKIFIEDNNLHFRTDIGWKDVERKIT
ncbi:MAG: phosphoribosylamine--glycine ligase [Candidatus Levybacteria bacterium]|nr:phosphoribosylamine--glycine ligase [Candidatus Levybacteria bacterium]